MLGLCCQSVPKVSLIMLIYKFCSGDKFWIGCYRDAGTTDLYWLYNKAKLVYGNWLPGQPDKQGHELCCDMGFYSSSPDKWNDIGCIMKFFPLCKLRSKYFVYICNRRFKDYFTSKANQLFHYAVYGGKWVI